MARRRATPGPEAPAMEPVLVTQALNALYAIASLAIIALGLAVVLGLLGVLNIAHGELVMIGAYCAYVVQANGWPYLAAIPLALAICGVLGYAVERWVVRPLYDRPFDTLVVTWGLSLLLRKCVEAIFGLGYKSLREPIGGTVELLGATYPRLSPGADRHQRGRSRRPRPLVRPKPHRHAHQGDGRQPRSGARPRHSGAPLRGGDLRGRHLPGRAGRRADRAARAGAAVHGPRPHPDVVLRSRRRRPGQRRRPA